MFKYKFVLNKWCFRLSLLLLIVLFIFSFYTYRYLFIPPTTIPSATTFEVLPKDEETLPSDALFKSPSIISFDFGTSSFTNDLGETITYPIQGTLGIPSRRDQAFPIVFIFPGYKEIFSLDTTRLDVGFTYLVQALSAKDYLTISLNIPPDYFVGHNPNETSRRIAELFTSHLHYLNRALTGEEIGYGLDITGLGDLSQTSFISYSMHAKEIYDLVDCYKDSNELSLSSLLFIAPTYTAHTKINLLDIPTSIIIPEQDGITLSLDGQSLYHDLTQLTSHHSPFSLTYLYGANHNAFNSLTEIDDSLHSSREITSDFKLTPHNQRDFLSKYSTDFLDSILKQENLGIGLEAYSPAPSTLYGYDVLTTLHPPVQLPIFLPNGEYHEQFNALGGDIKLKNASLSYVTDSYIPSRDTAGPFLLPGNPLEFPLLRLNWNVPSGVISTYIPEKYQDVSGYSSLSLSIALDPSNGLNPSNLPQSFILEFRDTLGKAQRVLVDSTIGALAYPNGHLITNAFTSSWSSFTPLSSLRVPLILLNQIDLSRLHSISFIFNQTPSGSLMLGDMSFIK